MDNRTYFYARVSTKGQNLARQIEAFKAMGADDRQIITDKASGKDTNRPGYQTLKENILRKGDTLVIKSLDRLSRCKADIKRELQYFQENGVRVKIIDLPSTMMDFPKGQELLQDTMNNLMIELIGMMAEQERLNIKARQAEGQAAMPVGEDGKRHSIKTGNAEGRPCVERPENWAEVMKAWKSGSITAKKAMELTNMKRTSFYKLVKEDEAA